MQELDVMKTLPQLNRTSPLVALPAVELDPEMLFPIAVLHLLVQTWALGFGMMGMGFSWIWFGTCTNLRHTAV